MWIYLFFNVENDAYTYYPSSYNGYVIYRKGCWDYGDCIEATECHYDIKTTCVTSIREF